MSNILNKQEDRIQRIKNYLLDEAKKIDLQLTRFEIVDCKYFKSINAIIDVPAEKRHNFFNECRYQIFVGPKGGILKARKNYLGEKEYNILNFLYRV